MKQKSRLEQESKILEYKENTNSKTFLKTVSAFANYRTGRIIFGVTDDLNVAGLENTSDARLAIENKINDCIKPAPEFDLEANEENKTVTLTVYQGQNVPYLLDGRAYARHDKSTVRVDQAGFAQLAKSNPKSSRKFDQLPADDQQLTFHQLQADLHQRLNVEKLSEDLLRGYGLFTQDAQYNNAAALFADQNQFPGVDVARFGDTTSTILDRQERHGVSVLMLMHATIEIYKRYYQYDVIKGMLRETLERVPEEAFREALANGLVHRDWELPRPIQISFFDDRIELSSPGGLLPGINQEEYLNSQMSVLRNPTVAGVMFQLNYIESFGTGVRRIKECYQGLPVQPDFKITEHQITVILPASEPEDQATLPISAQQVLAVMNPGQAYSRPEIDRLVGFDRGKTIRLLNQLVKNRKLTKVGRSRATRYIKQ